MCRHILPYWLLLKLLRKFSVKISLKRLFTLPCFKIFNLSFGQKLFLRETFAFVFIKTIHKYQKKHNCCAEFEQLNVKGFSCLLDQIYRNLRLHEKFNFCSVVLSVSIIANYGAKIKCKYLIFVSVRCV